MWRNEETRGRWRTRGLTTKTEIYRRGEGTSMKEEGQTGGGRRGGGEESGWRPSLWLEKKKRPEFPLWLCPSLTPSALLLIQNTHSYQTTSCNVVWCSCQATVCTRADTHAHTNSLEQLDLNMHPCTTHTHTDIHTFTQQPAGTQPRFLESTSYTQTSLGYIWYMHRHTNALCG